MKNSIITDNAACGFTDISGVKKNTPYAAPEQCMEEKRHAADDAAKVFDDGEGKIKPTLSDEVKVLDGGTGETKTVLSDGDEAEESRADSSAEAHSCVNSVGEGSEAEKEDKEFLALIKGRYREAYRRRTESIIRRRLKSARAKANSFSDTASVSEKQESVCAADGVFDIDRKNDAVVKEIADAVKSAYSGAINTLGALDTRSGLGAEGGVLSSAQIKERAEIQKNANRSRPRENGVGGSVGMITGINVSALKGSDVLELLRRAEAGEKIKFK